MFNYQRVEYATYNLDDYLLVSLGMSDFWVLMFDLLSMVKSWNVEYCRMKINPLMFLLGDDKSSKDLSL